MSRHEQSFSGSGGVVYIAPTQAQGLLSRRSTITETLQQLIAQGGSALQLVPVTLKEALECEVWRDRLTPNKAVVSNATFLEWVTTPYPHGIGATVELVRELCQRDPAMLVAFDRAVQGQHGGDRRSAAATNLDNVQVGAPEAPTGNSAQAGIRRIRKAAEAGDVEAAAALARVEAGEQSVHAAMLALGWRRKTVTLPDDPSALAEAALKRCGALGLFKQTVLALDRKDLLAANWFLFRHHVPTRHDEATRAMWFGGMLHEILNKEGIL